MAANDRLRLAVIIGSTRKGRFGPVPAAWFADQAREHGFDVDVIDLAAAALPTIMPDFGDPAPAGVEELGSRLDGADAFVVVTPEYNHSYPAPLKGALDLFMQQWKAKPVGFVSYGAMSGGVRAVEHLRQVFAEFHTVTVRDALAFAECWNRFDDQGRPTDNEGATRAAKAMLDQLSWWAEALHGQRAVRPYAA